MSTPIVTFHQQTPAKHPVRNTFLHRIEVTPLPETPQAAESSIARFLPADASLTKDECGVTLKYSDKDGAHDVTFGWPMVSGAYDVPRAEIAPGIVRAIEEGIKRAFKDFLAAMKAAGK